MWIELTAADGHKLAAWQDGPRDAKRTLVVVQEIFGVNQHMRHVCDAFVAQGYAVANSNTGHDSGAEPRASFAHDDLDAMIDFGHRAVHF